MFLCKNGIEGLDIHTISKKYNTLLESKFWRSFAEPHYSIIKPCIIAEELLDCTKQCIHTDSLIDYKVWCFSGKPFCIWTCYNRTPETVEVGSKAGYMDFYTDEILRSMGDKVIFPKKK